MCIYIYIYMFLHSCWVDHFIFSWGGSRVLAPVRRGPDVANEPRKRPQNMGRLRLGGRMKLSIRLPQI